MRRGHRRQLRRRGQTEIATALIILTVIAVAALVAYWYISVARIVTGRPLLRTGSGNTITASGGRAYVCVYNDGTVGVDSATIELRVTVGGTVYSGSASVSTIPPSGSRCVEITVGGTTPPSIGPGVTAVDGTIIVRGTAGGRAVEETIPTQLTVIRG